jgi:DNA replication protein DnaC
MTDTPQLLLAHHLKALKLPTFLREYDKLARQCAAEGLDHIRFLPLDWQRGLVGNSGTGKTHIGLGLGLAACQKGLSVGKAASIRSGCE